MPFLMIYTTHPDKATAQSIADALLQKRLVACANFHAIESAYHWSGQVCKEGEWVAIFKTRSSLREKVWECIRELHPYDVPCMVYWEVEANPAYGQWVHDETKAK